MSGNRILGRVVLTVGLCVGLLMGCIGYSSNGLRIVITDNAITPSMDGHHVSCSVFEEGGLDCLAWGGDTLRDGRSVTIGLYDGIQGGSWEGVPGQTYDLEVWVDMNDNVEEEPAEPGIDYVTSPTRLKVVLEESTFGMEFVVNGPFVVAAAP